MGFMDLCPWSELIPAWPPRIEIHGIPGTYPLEYIMYSTINVKMGNKTLKTIVVSLPMFVVCKIKKIINPSVIACKIPKM